MKKLPFSLKLSGGWQTFHFFRSTISLTNTLFVNSGGFRRGMPLRKRCQPREIPLSQKIF